MAELRGTEPADAARACLQLAPADEHRAELRSFCVMNGRGGEPMDQQTGSPMNADQAGVFAGQNNMTLEALLPDYLRRQRWFSAKARDIARVRIVGEISFALGAAGSPQAHVTFI